MIPHVSQIVPPYRPIFEITPDYSLLPIEEGFNWDEAFAAIDEGEWYLVVFRSKHRADADEAHLTFLDEQASSAASRTPGFMYYFIGTPLADGHCLSFCLWQSREAALVGASDPAHREAMIEGLPAFEYYRLERYYIHKRAGEVAFTALIPTEPQGHPHAVPAQRVNGA
ncbi:MAG: hypothetical protein SF162_08730 [bacterium]|nr:hypothetical protein [bacterium]